MDIANKQFDLDLPFGEIKEELTRKILCKDSGVKVEVKTDRMAHITGNIAIEIESRGKPSGIMTSESHYWTYWINELGVGIHMKKEKILEMIKDKTFVWGGDNYTSKLILIPIGEIFRLNNS